MDNSSASPPGSAYWVAPLVYDPNNQMTVYDFRDAVYKSEDFGTTWVNVGKPFWNNTTRGAV